MIILLGPDGAGKTTLADKLGLVKYHHTRDSDYMDYLRPLCKLELTDAVLDRAFFCEFPYSVCMNRPFKFTQKQWHNMITMTLIQKPLIILCTRKPFKYEYKREQYLPYELWDECLQLYRSFLSTHHIAYIEYDYLGHNDVSHYIKIANAFSAGMSWWREHWTAGYGCAGSSSPKFLLVAERIGPNNINNIPFETGPTGYMLSSMFQSTGTPLGVIAVTNMVKSFRRDTRVVNDEDIELLREEITQLRPKKVIFMGTPAKRGIPLARELGCETATIVHLGALSHKGITDMTGYNNEWRKILGMVPKIEYK